MLFRRNILPSCAYCKHGVSIGFDDVACRKRGIMSEEGSCNAFRYEPTKRKPEFTQNTVMVKFSEEEMRL